jgi:hypothetical protein
LLKFAQGSLIASAMILVQQTEQTCPKVKDFRQIYTKVSIFKSFFVVSVGFKSQC